MACTDPSAFATDEELLAVYPQFADTEWTVTVTDAADGTYTVTMLGVDYDYVAAGATLDDIRDGLEAAMASQGDAVVVAETTPQLTLVGTVPGRSLAVETSPATLIATDAITPAIRDCALESTKRVFCTSRWGNKLCAGHLAATAHWLSMWSDSSGSTGVTPWGMTTSMTQGPFSQSWAAPTMNDGSDSWWATTPFGAQYLALRATLPPVAVGMVMGGCRTRYPRRRLACR